MLEVFDSHFSIFFVICLNHFYILQASFFDPLGKLTALLGKLMENPRLLLENLFSMYVGHGSGWAGGVTRSVKNSKSISLVPLCIEVSLNCKIARCLYAGLPELLILLIDDSYWWFILFIIIDDSS